MRVPVGRGSRVAIVLGRSKGDFEGEIREIAGPIDACPLLPSATLELLRWFSETYLCGIGSTAKTLLPSGFMAGQEIDLGRKKGEPPAAEGFRGIAGREASGRAGDVAFLYEPEDELRLAQYAAMLADELPTLVSFPLYPAAKRFYETLLSSDALSEDLKKRMTLFPRSGAKAEWRTWSRLLAMDEASIVIGGQSSAMAPLRGLSRVIVEDESNNIWRTVRAPIYNVRSLLAKRAQLEGAALVLGGRMPSSRAFAQAEKTPAVRHTEDGRPLGRTVFVDLRLAYAPSVKGVCDTLAVSEPLVRETESVLSRGAWVLWLLDRKGYAGEVLCEECGVTVTCDRCGGAMRWEAARARLRCVVCSEARTVPENCPVCGGRLLTAKRPGLEALLPLARAAINAGVPILLHGDDEEDPAVESSLRESSGLLLGTRAALAACDRLRVGLVSWLDADGEARSQDYDAKARAFGLMWESRWRGLDPAGRTLVLQSRRPGREWQKGLEDARSGWHVFWRKELAERSEFGMPPYNALVRVDCPPSEIAAISDRLGDAFEYWVSEGDGAPRPARSSIWIRTLKIGELRRTLAPFFHIKRAGRRGYPGITVWHD